MDKYQQEIIPQLMKEMKLKNSLAVPKLEKIVINIGLGEALKDKSVIEKVSEQLALISGQKPVPTLARKSIASFKLRKGNIVGLKVTLRRKKMYHFLEKLINVVLPQIKDFRGVSSQSFDGAGNYTLGIKELNVFLETESIKIDKIRGMEITMVTTAKNNKDSKRLLEALGMPFKKSG